MGGKPLVPAVGALCRVASVTAALALTGLAAGCASDSGGSSSGGAVESFFRAGAEDKGTIDPELLKAEAPCPQVRILAGTESIRRGDPNVANADADADLRWQASISKTARECKPGADGVTLMRVGVSGRIVQGVRGAPDRVELPVRVAVREGGEVTYSRLHNVTIARSGVSQDWAFVDESVVVKNPRGAEIVVGFDG